MAENRTVYEALRAPFPSEQVYWKPQAVSKDNKRALVVAYTDVRHIFDRLDAVVGPANWQTAIQPGDKGVYAGIGIKINGEWIWKWDCGEILAEDGVKAKGDVSDAYKRAAVQWGIGRYLYSLPKSWVDYDPERKTITEDAKRQLKEMYRRYLNGQVEDGSNNSHDTSVKIPPVSEKATKRARSVEIAFGRHKGKSLGEIFDVDPDYVLWLSNNAEDTRIRAAALYLMQLRQDRESEKIESQEQEIQKDNGSLGDPGSVVMPFGKFRGKTLAEIAELEPDYIGWLADNARDPKVQQATAALLEAIRVPA